jgi:hypothetical protein
MSSVCACLTAAVTLCVVFTSQTNPARLVDSCPTDPSLFAASCVGAFRMFRFSDGSFRPTVVTAKREIPDCLCHAWLPEDRVVIGTTTGVFLCSTSLITFFAWS